MKWLLLSALSCLLQRPTSLTSTNSSEVLDSELYMNSSDTSELVQVVQQLQQVVAQQEQRYQQLQQQLQQVVAEPERHQQPQKVVNSEHYVRPSESSELIQGMKQLQQQIQQQLQQQRFQQLHQEQEKRFELETELQQVAAQQEHLQRSSRDMQLIIRELQNSLQQQFAELETRYDEQKTNVQNLQNPAVDFQQLKTQTSEVDVAFSAFVDTGDWKLYQKGETVLFNAVEYNSGGFNVVDSKYHCPVTGLYCFNVNVGYMLYHRVGWKFEVQLLKGGTQHLAQLYSYNVRNSQFGSEYQMASTSVITECSAGQTIHVAANRTSSIWGSSDEKLTTFNGILLKQYQ